MTEEDIFIKRLSVFLDMDFNDYSKDRIRSYLKKYIEQQPPVTIREYIEVQVEVEVDKEKKVKVTNEDLMRMAVDYCTDENVNVNLFVKSTGKSSNRISEVRKIFCKDMIKNFDVPKYQLKDFFGVDHTTISFYIHGKKYKNNSSKL
jgi:hypothetical protein